MEDDKTPSAVSQWVGIDGYNNKIVVQAGFDSILDDEGEVTYKAWVQVGLRRSHYIPFEYTTEVIYAVCNIKSPFQWSNKSLPSIDNLVTAVDSERRNIYRR